MRWQRSAWALLVATGLGSAGAWLPVRAQAPADGYHRIVVRLAGDPRPGPTLLVTDSRGRRTGVDPMTRAPYREIPGGTVAEEGVDALQSGTPSIRDEEVDLFRPADGSYRLAVTGRSAGLYGLEIDALDREGDQRGAWKLRDVPTTPGLTHLYVLDYAAAPAQRPRLAGGFTGTVGRASEADLFLTYASPTSTRTQLRAHEWSFALVIFYDRAILPETFRATLNGMDITARFARKPSSHEVVTIPVTAGANTLVLSVDGRTRAGTVATDTDRLVLAVE